MDCVRIRKILKRSGTKYKKGGKREQVTVKRVHAAQLGRGDTQLHRSWGGGGGGAASKTGRSIAPVPSCMPCMSFLAFEAFCFIRRERRRDQK